MRKAVASILSFFQLSLYLYTFTIVKQTPQSQSHTIRSCFFNNCLQPRLHHAPHINRSDWPRRRWRA